MKFLQIILLFIVSSHVSIGQTPQIDSILEEQNKTLKKICSEIEEIGIEISKIDSSKFRPNNVVLSQDTSQFRLNHTISQTLNEINEKSFGDMLYKSFGHLVSALIAAIIGLWIFFGQWKKEKNKQEEIRLKGINEKNQYLKSILNGAISLSENYKSSLEQFTEELKSNPFNIPDIKLYPLQVLSRLQKTLDNEEYFHAYIYNNGDSEESINRFRNISALSDYLVSQISELQKKDYKRKDNDLKIRYINLFEETLDETTEIGKSNETENRSIFIAFDKILGNYIPHIEHGFVTDISIGQNEFIKPLKKELLSNFFNLKEMRLLLKKVGKTTRLYNEIPFQNNGTLKLYLHFQETLDEVLDKIKEETKHIK